MGSTAGHIHSLLAAQRCSDLFRKEQDIPGPADHLAYPNGAILSRSMLRAHFGGAVGVGFCGRRLG